MSTVAEKPRSVRCPICFLRLPDPEAKCPACARRRPEESTAWGEWLRTLVERDDHSAPLSSAFSPEKRYELLGTLGRGAVGVVYKVRDLELDEIIAVKVLDPRYARRKEAVEAFKNELKVARRINHPNVARLHELLVWRERLSISQEYIEGETLERVLRRGRLSPQVIAGHMRYLCSGLAAAHKIGVIHRDFKPGNVMVDREGRPHILDFGTAVLAGVTQSSSRRMVCGTPWYMSPEQAFAPQSMDHRSDIYSLGMVLYQASTGTMPFEANSMEQVLRAHRDTRPLPARAVVRDLPAEFEAVILRCLEKDPKDRYQSAGAVLKAISDALGLGLKAERAASDKRQRCILVVDDDTMTRMAIGEALRRRNVRVLEATNGYEGMQRALEGKPDLVLLDEVMPILDGRETLRILKSNPQTGEIPVIMMSELTDADEVVFAREMGALCSLNKPIQPDILELLLEKHAS